MLITATRNSHVKAICPSQPRSIMLPPFSGFAAANKKTFTRGMVVHAVSKGLASPTGVAWSRSRVGLATVLTGCGPAAGQPVATPLYVMTVYQSRKTLSTAIEIRRALQQIAPMVGFARFQAHPTAG
jgi:hypothetical protein